VFEIERVMLLKELKEDHLKKPFCWSFNNHLPRQHPED
jgi:hypothetical protein